MSNIYITTPIYYVNGDPHIGHFYTTLACDILVRLYQNDGYDVRYLTGTDEHGQKVQQSAEKKGISPKAFCDEVSTKFRQMMIDFDLIQAENNFNNGNSWIRTTDEKHINFIQNVWKRLEENGWLYKGKYEGWYSVRDETFFTETELVNGKAPTGAEVVWQEEECYFFRLSVFQNALYEMYKKYDILQPKGSFKEVLSFLEPRENNKLKDLCVSRSKKSFNWGIEVPTDENHTIYVWIDALFNYFSALGGDSTEEFNKYWKDGFPIHIMAKEIVRFHAVYWESLIYGLYHKYGEEINVDELAKVSPKQIFAHGWWVKDGEKMSKSIGNVVSPYDEVEWLEKNGIQHNIAIDYLRYFLMSCMPFGNDGDYTRPRFVEMVNANLVNNLGNLVQRVCSMLVKNFAEKCSGIDKNFEKMNFENEIKKIDFTEILNAIFAEATRLNQEFDASAPWILIKGNEDDKAKAFEILSNLVPRIARVVDAVETFCPHIAKKLKKNLELTKMPEIICSRITLK